MLADVANGKRGSITYGCHAVRLKGLGGECMIYSVIHMSHTTADGLQFFKRDGRRESENELQGDIELSFDKGSWRGSRFHGELEGEEEHMTRG